jgi:23S rRNA (adenine2503-C2)-methyltransferase
MPIERTHPTAELVAALHDHARARRTRVLIEYVLLGGVNDSPEDARRLVRLLRGVRAKVNLIPFNEWDGSPFRRPPLARILAFQSILLDADVTTTVRWSKGEDIGAACGQLLEPVPGGRASRRTSAMPAASPSEASL